MTNNDIFQLAHQEINLQGEMTIDNKAALLFSLIANDGGIISTKKGDKLFVVLHNRKLAIDIFNMVDDESEHAELQLSKPQDKRKKEYAKIIFNSQLTQYIFRRIGITPQFFKGEGKYPDWIMENEDNAKSFLQGVFLAVGRLYLPDMEKDKKEGAVNNRSLQFSFNSNALADYTARVLLALNIKCDKLSYIRTFKLILRSIERIAFFFSIIGATKTALLMYNLMVENDAKKRNICKINCEISNMQKSADSSARLIIIIDYLIENGKFALLPKEVQESALLRKNYPMESIEQLAKKSIYPVSKSGFNHRMRRVVKLYKEIKSEEDDE